MSNEPYHTTGEQDAEPLQATRRNTLFGARTHQGTPDSDGTDDGVRLFCPQTLTRREALRRGGLVAGGLALGGSTVTRTVDADRKSGESQGNGTETSVASIAEEAYRYGLQQVIFYVTRFNYTQKEDSDFFVGVNRLYYPNEGRPITADFTAVVSPNATTLYGQGFLDLQDEPVVIEMPEVTDRYFSLELMDQYGIYPLYAGNQFNGTDARSYLILPDDYEGEIPGDFAATDVVQAGTKTLLTELRYALRDSNRIDYVRAVDASRPENPLTDRQLEVFRTALEAGYYDVPREATLTDVASALGVTKSTCSGVLHRAESTIAH